MKIICKHIGGSHSYGLNTPASDIDYRGVFLNTDIKHIIGLEKHEHQQKQNESTDEVYTEFRNALKMLRTANTQMVELLFNENWILLSDEWKTVIKHRAKLVDSEKLFSCLRGYMQGELRLALGERTGKLGGKRFAQVEKYGYSPKNMVQLIRLAWCGITYFQEGTFPVNIVKADDILGSFLLSIKTEPEKYAKEQLRQECLGWEEKLVHAFEHRQVTTHFDDTLANDLVLKVYGYTIAKEFEQITL